MKNFEVGQIYPMQDICYKVIRRTAKTVTFVHETACSKVLGLNQEKVTRKTVEYDDNGNEVVYGFSAFGRLEAAVDLHAYEVRFKCKLVEGNEFISYDWTDVVDVDAEEVTAEEIVENTVEEIAEVETAEVKEETKMKETTKGYEVCTSLWNEEKGGYKHETTTFDSVKAAFTFANNFINANSQREKDEFDVWVYDNEDNHDIFRMVYGRKAYGKPVVIGNRSAQRVDYAAIMEEVILEAENAADNTENKIDVTADLEAELAEVNNKISEHDEDIVRYEHWISDYKYEICQCEKALESVNEERDELAKKATAIENEIANRKIIEVTDEIVTADAVDASVEAMTAVTFDLQAFNDDEKEIEEIRKQIAELDAQINALEVQKAKLSLKISEYGIASYGDTILQDKKIIANLFNCQNGFTINNPSISENYYVYFENDIDWKGAVFCDETEKGWAIYTDLDGAEGTGVNKLRIAEYSTAAQFKKVVQEIAAAILNGDEEYTCPADEIGA